MVAVGALGLRAGHGPVLCSAPSHVAVDNLAERIDRVDLSVCERYNGRNAENPIRRRIIVRGHKMETEYRAFTRLLVAPTDGDNAALGPKGRKDSKWKLHLSITFWLLVLLGSCAKGVRPLHEGDSASLCRLRDKIEDDPDLQSLRQVAAGAISWGEYDRGEVVLHDKINALFADIVAAADFLCTTPAATSNVHQFWNWKEHVARGIVVDEAGSMNRCDLADVWGNTLLPCLLGGDPRQLPPTVMTRGQSDSLGNLYNRLPDDGAISPMLFFQCSGLPVHRQHTQLRMARGLFNMVAAGMYPEVPFKYGPNCDINLEQFAPGRALEKYLARKYSGLRAPPEGELTPVLLHRPDSVVWKDPKSGSKTCRDQVRVGLDFAADLVRESEVEAAHIAIICPYKANVKLVEKWRKREKYGVLAGMQPCCTVDGFQGREAEIIVVIMGTSEKSRPGFTCFEQRLNVLLTRQRSGLVIITDLYSVPKIRDSLVDGGKAKKGKGKAEEKFQVDGVSGELCWVKAKFLRAVCVELWKSGRVVDLGPEVKKGKEEGGNEVGVKSV